MFRYKKVRGVIHSKNITKGDSYRAKLVLNCEDYKKLNKEYLRCIYGWRGTLWDNYHSIHSSVSRPV